MEQVSGLAKVRRWCQKLNLWVFGEAPRTESHHSPHLEKITNKQLLVFMLFIALMFFIRFYALNSDPLFFKRMGDVGDEFHNWLSARNKALFGKWVVFDVSLGNLGIVVEPVNTFLVFLSYKIFGVSLASGRIPSAFSGVFVLLLFFWINKKYNGFNFSFLAAVLLGLNLHFISYNRLGFVETSSTLFLLLTTLLLALAYEKKSPLFIFLSGMLAGICVVLKISNVVYMPVFFLIAVLYIRRGRWNLHDMLLVLFGFALPVTLYLIVLYSEWSISRSVFNGLLQANDSKINFFTMIHGFIGNRYNMQPSVLLLYFLAFAPFCRSVLRLIKEFCYGTSEMDISEVLFCCWGVGLIFVLVLLPVKIDRRFFPLLIPLAYYAASWTKKNNKTFYVEPSTFVGLLLVVVFAKIPFMPIKENYTPVIFSLASLLLLLFYLVARKTYGIKLLRMVTLLLSVSAVLFFPPSSLAVLALFVCSICFIYEKANKPYIWSATFCLSVILISYISKESVSLISSRVEDMFNGVPTVKIISSVVPAMLVTLFFFCIGVIVLKRKKIPTSLYSLLSIAYVTLSLGAIVFWYSNMSFSVRDISRKISKYVSHGSIISGSVAEILTAENEAIFYFWLPRTVSSLRIGGETVKSGKLEFATLAIDADGKFRTPDKTEWPTLLDLEQLYSLELLAKFEGIYPAPVSGKYNPGQTALFKLKYKGK